MPFICLANANVPEGVLQITDLWPNVSQHNNPTFPAGQNRYLRRPVLDAPAVHLVTGVVAGAPAVANLQNFDGLGAYLVDKVEPGALEQATANITLAVNPNALDRIVIDGVIYIEFSAGATDATTAGTVGDPFICQIQGTAALTAVELVNNVINAAAAKVTMRGLNGNIYVLGTAPGAGVVQLDTVFDTGGGENNQLGNTGDLTLALAGVGAATRITLPVPHRLARPHAAWTAAHIAATTAAIMAAVDAGTANMNLAAIVALLTANAGADLTGAAATSGSVGTVLEFLSVLAGRTYRLPAAGLKFTAVTAPDQVHIWSNTLRGSFTTPNTTWDTDMDSGEWGATTADVKWLKTSGGNNKPIFNAGGGGDVVNNEIGDARDTLDSTHFQASINTGQLAQFAAGVNLFPDPDVQAFVDRRSALSPLALQRQAPLLNQRLVTVYDDDGTLLV